MQYTLGLDILQYLNQFAQHLDDCTIHIHSEVCRCSSVPMLNLDPFVQHLMLATLCSIKCLQ